MKLDFDIRLDDTIKIELPRNDIFQNNPSNIYGF